MSLLWFILCSFNIGSPVSLNDLISEVLLLIGIVILIIYNNSNFNNILFI